jgi:chromosomal replication initiation ATPase DnaA
MTGAVASVTIRLGDRTIEQLQAVLDGWDADVEIKSRAPSIAEVLAYVERRHDCTVEQLLGRIQSRRVLDLRGLVAWFAFQRLGHSLTEIGRALGARDHTYVWSQIARATSARSLNPEFDAMLADLLDHFGYEAVV